MDRLNFGYVGSHKFVSLTPLTCDIVKINRSESNIQTIYIDCISQDHKRCNWICISFQAACWINVWFSVCYKRYTGISKILQTPQAQIIIKFARIELSRLKNCAFNGKKIIIIWHHLTGPSTSSIYFIA